MSENVFPENNTGINVKDLIGAALTGLDEAIDRYVEKVFDRTDASSFVREQVKQASKAMAEVQYALGEAQRFAQEAAQHGAGSAQRILAEQLQASYQKTAEYALNNHAGIFQEISANRELIKHAKILGDVLGSAMDAAQMANAVLGGDAYDVGEASTSVLFGMAGAAVGATVFAAIATYLLVGVPVILAAAVGAAYFGLVGSELGKDLWGWFADKLGLKHGISFLQSLAEILNISSPSNDDYLDARTGARPVDPLALDLDGDGLETVGINGYETVLFDHDGDGVKTGTGWVKSDDGLLVLDRNGNGQIDDGSELFGVDTLKSDGEKAASGLDALADLDGNGDGVFDRDDAQFANVRIWRDKDQDGIADEGELTTLADAGIVSIDLDGAAVNRNLGNGNGQTQTTTFTRADGTVGEAGSLELAENPFYREFLERISLSSGSAQLPDMRGSGVARDLREAAEGSPELAARRKALQEAGLMDRAEYREQLEAANDAAFADGHAVERKAA